MRGPKIYGCKFHPKGGAPKFTDLNFIQKEGPLIYRLKFHPNGRASDFKKYDKFLQWSKNKYNMRGPQIYGRKFHPKVGALKVTDLNFIQTVGPLIFKNMIKFTTVNLGAPDFEFIFGPLKKLIIF
jgi:hypothetical protein